MTQHSRVSNTTPSTTIGAPGPVERAWSEFLARYEWRFFVTLTSRYPAPSKRLVGEFRRFIHRLERITKAQVSWFYAIEADASGQKHIHALLQPSVIIPTKVLEAEWRLGYTHIRRFDAARGASYVAKELGPDGPSEYDLSTHLRPTSQGVPPRGRGVVGENGQHLHPAPCGSGTASLVIANEKPRRRFDQPKNKP